MLIAASSVLHHPVGAEQLCASLQHATSGTSLQGGPAAAPKPSGNVLYDDFVHNYVGNVLSTSFDRTFAFIAIITIVGVIPALFLRRPERRPKRSAVAP